MSLLNLYFDDTGSRYPDKKTDNSRVGRDWFALGGFVIRQEDESKAKEDHAAFIERWNIRSPLHITDILAQRKGFSWIGKLKDQQYDQFWSEYKTFMAELPVMGLACVIDRPGYVARGYLEAHPGSRWLLCRSAFDILVERSAKIAALEGRRLGVIFEGDIAVNESYKQYFKNLKENGMGFDDNRSEKYGPLTNKQFSNILTTIEYKDKRSSLLQIADSYVYAMARHPYDKKFDLYRRLVQSKKIANLALPQEHIARAGVKYYCFELHMRSRYSITTNEKAGIAPGSFAAPVR